jgi:hypothetical protein
MRVGPRRSGGLHYAGDPDHQRRPGSTAQRDHLTGSACLVGAQNIQIRNGALFDQTGAAL